jgi:hypothetical protein
MWLLLSAVLLLLLLLLLLAAGGCCCALKHRKTYLVYVHGGWVMSVTATAVGCVLPLCCCAIA